MSIPKERRRRVILENSLRSTIHDKVTILIPVSLTKELLGALKPNDIDEDVWIDNCRFIVHCIVYQQHNKGPEFLNQFVPLYSKKLKAISGNYRLYLDSLISAGVITENSSYSTLKGISKSYKLCEKYQSSEMRYVTLSNHKIRKLKLQDRKARVKSVLPILKPLAKLNYWLITERLSLDKESALSCLERIHRRAVKIIEDLKIEPKNRSKLMDHLKTSYYWNKHQIEHWNTSRFIVDNRGGRLYSALTRLPTIFRNYLSYEGQPMVIIDLKNSQPFHMLFLMTSNFWVKKRGICLKVLLPELYQHLKHIGNPIHHLSLPIMCRKLTHIADLQYDRATTFDQLVLSGKLYEFINHKFHGQFFDNQVDRFQSRDQSKAEFLHMMYHNPQERFSQAIPVFALFKAIFPQEARIMELVKSLNYTHFPILLQTIEAQMLLHKISDAIYDLDHTLPIFTIHDSYITLMQHKEVVINAIKKEYEQILGVSPQLHTTSLNPDAAEEGELRFVKKKINKLLHHVKDDKFCENWDFKTRLTAELKTKINALIPEMTIYPIRTGNGGHLYPHN